MCALAMNESSVGIGLEHQLSSSALSSDDLLLYEFDLEQTADLLSVSLETGWQLLCDYRPRDFNFVEQSKT